MSDAKNQHRYPFVLDLTDQAPVTYTVFPRVPQILVPAMRYRYCGDRRAWRLDHLGIPEFGGQPVGQAGLDPA